MALFQNRIILGGAEGSLYICDQSGAVLDVRAKAHQSTVSALLCVGAQLWSGSDDGMLHTWEMKVPPRSSNLNVLRWIREVRRGGGHCPVGVNRNIIITSTYN